jgi:Tfp pilus assembly protein PilV
MKSQKGSSMIEIVVALALLGSIGVTFLSALGTTSNSRTVSSEHTVGRIMAASQMDAILNSPYAFTYSPMPVPSEYEGYTTTIDIANISDGSLQKITVTVKHHDEDVTKLESYKVIR